MISIERAIWRVIFRASWHNGVTLNDIAEEELAFEALRRIIHARRLNDLDKAAELAQGVLRKPYKILFLLRLAQIANLVATQHSEASAAVTEQILKLFPVNTAALRRVYGESSSAPVCHALLIAHRGVTAFFLSLLARLLLLSCSSVRAFEKLN